MLSLRELPRGIGGLLVGAVHEVHLSPYPRTAETFARGDSAGMNRSAWLPRRSAASATACA